MSCKEYEDGCRGCEPAILNPVTGIVMPDTDPRMRAILKMFRTESTLMERQAWHRVCVLNSRVPLDMALARKIMKRVEQILSDMDEVSKN